MIQRIYGHRGARGLYPENTIYGFMSALNFHVIGFELDIVVSKDRQLIISHEPWMNHQICTDAKGLPISGSAGKGFNIYKMDYDEISKFDCGSKCNPLIPSQQSFPAVKPTLGELAYRLKEEYYEPIELLIEIKSSPEWYGIYQPEPDEYASQIVAYLKDLEFKIDPVLMSFDPNILNAINHIGSNYRIGFLVNNAKSVRENLSSLDFKPDQYNLEHTRVNVETHHELSNKNIDVIPWTVNSVKDANRLSEIGITSIVTGYPNFFL
jgi:glycerophosphoryl diester phosphodiesterase